MCQHTYRRIAISQRFAMGIDIHPIGQTTDNQHLGTIFLQIPDKTADKVLTIGRDMTSAHNTDNLSLIQVCITFIIEYEWCVRTFAETLWVVIVSECNASDAVLLHIFQFKICPFHRIIPVLKSRLQMGRGILDNIPNLIPVFKQHLSTANHFV